MKRVLSVFVAALFLLTALPMLALADSHTVTVIHNEGGITGYNTNASSTDFAEIASGGTFEVQAGGGLTVGALPNGGYTVTEIYRDRQPIDPNLVYISRDGVFVVDHGDVNADETIEFVFASSDRNEPFDARGQEPGAPGEICFIHVTFNAGGTVGFNTTGSSTEFTALASGDYFEVNEHSGMTIGALPAAGNTVTAIYLDDEPINSDWVYTTDEGRFIVDCGDVDKGYEVQFVFASAEGNDPFEGTGRPPFGPDDDRPNFDTAIYFPLDGNRFGWDIDATFGSIGNGFVNDQGKLEIPATRGADVRIRIHPQQLEDGEFGTYYPHLGSIFYTDQMGEQFIPYYRMKDVSDPEKEAPQGIFVYETVIQNVQDPIEIGFTEDEWHGHINQVLDPEAEPRLLDNIIDVDLITGERVFVPDLSGILPLAAGVYKVGDLPYLLSDELVALGFSLDDDFVEISNTEWGEPLLFTLLLDMKEPFEKEFTGEYDAPHPENLLSKIIVGAYGTTPDETQPIPEGDAPIPVLNQFDPQEGVAVFRFDYYFDQAMVQRRDVLFIKLAPPQPETDTPNNVLYGDANRDDSVDMKDVLLIRKYIAHMVGDDAIDLVAADVNFDSGVDMKDVLLIRKYLAHQLDGFVQPAESEPEWTPDPYELPPMPL